MSDSSDEHILKSGFCFAIESVKENILTFKGQLKYQIKYFI